MNDKLKINTEERLIDRLIIDNSIFMRDDIDLKKYQYMNSYLEDLKIKDLMDANYRKAFVKYLKEIKTEDDEFKSTLVSQLLFLRMVQLSDSNAFFLLSEFSKDDLIAYNGIELYSEKLVRYFIENPLFFIQQGTKYQEVTILNSLNAHLEDFFVQKSFFTDNLGEINFKSGQLFLNPEKEKDFSESFKEKISKFDAEEGVFSPSLYTSWENKTIKFIDISPIFGDPLIKKLNTFEINYFKQNILSTLKKYIINGDELRIATINDPDGFTNLRKEKSTSSEIIQQIKSSEQIQVLEKSGDWLLVKTNEGNQGYIHKSRINPH